MCWAQEWITLDIMVHMGHQHMNKGAAVHTIIWVFHSEITWMRSPWHIYTQSQGTVSNALQQNGGEKRTNTMKI